MQCFKYLDAGLPRGGGQLLNNFSSFSMMFSSDNGNFLTTLDTDVVRTKADGAFGVWPSTRPLDVRHESRMLRRLMASTLSFFKMRRLSADAMASGSAFLSWKAEFFRSVSFAIGGGEALPWERDDLPLDTAESLSESLSDLNKKI